MALTGLFFSQFPPFLPSFSACTQHIRSERQENSIWSGLAHRRWVKAHRPPAANGFCINKESMQSSECEWRPPQVANRIPSHHSLVRGIPEAIRYTPDRSARGIPQLKSSPSTIFSYDIIPPPGIQCYSFFLSLTCSANDPWLPSSGRNVLVLSNLAASSLEWSRVFVIQHARNAFGEIWPGKKRKLNKLLRHTRDNSVGYASSSSWCYSYDFQMPKKEGESSL